MELLPSERTEVEAQQDGLTYGAIVIHYRNYDVVPVTVSGIIASGIPTCNIVVVDNSEAAERDGDLRRSLADDVTILSLKNQGYGIAANTGVGWLRDNRPLVDTVLLATHEIRVLEGSLVGLLSAVRSAPGVGIAGPSLATGDVSAPLIWSDGGTFSKWLKVPKHVNHLVEYKPDRSRTSYPVGWVDGACMAARIQVLLDNPLREDFFLYLEEVELQIRLRDIGLASLLVPDVLVWQSSNGTPLFLLGRNLQLLLRTHGNFWQRVITVRYVWLRRMVGFIVRGKSPHYAHPILRGRSSLRIPR